MLIKTVKNLIQILILLALVTSCSEDLDFDQAENINVTPIVTSSIAFTEVQAPRFIVDGLEITTVTDSISDITIFREQFINDNLIKAELVFTVANNINRSFNLDVQFLDDTDELQYSFSFDVAESPSGNEVFTEYTEIIENENLDALKLTTQIVLKFTVGDSSDGSTLSENSIGKISLKSKGVFYFDINL